MHSPNIFREHSHCVPGCFDPFELCVRAILGQQITVKAAGTLAGKLAKALGQPIQTDISGLTYVFPSAQDLTAPNETIVKTLGSLGIIAARAQAIQSLAQKVTGNELDFAFGNHSEEEQKKLMGIRGIGPWTAAYIAMRALGDPDAFPETDFAIRKVLGGKKPSELRALSAQWKPWRSYAAMVLWDSLDTEEIT